MLLFFFLLWIILNGRVTLEIVVVGAVAAAAVFFFAHAVFGYSLSSEKLLFANIPLMILYFLNLILEVIKAAFQVACIVLIPSKHPDPVLVEFDSEFSRSFQNVILADSITLTPGTYTVKLDGNHFTVHCLTPALAEGLDDSSFVKLLRHVKAGIFGEQK